MIPFKHKGKVGEVKFIGEIDGKNQGNWVGIELLDPVGECDGDFNGNQIFECKPGHGLILRPTQVKSLNSPDVSKIMRMDESLMSGMDNLGSMIGADKDFNLGALNEDPTKEVTNIKVQEVED